MYIKGKNVLLKREEVVYKLKIVASNKDRNNV